MKIAKLMLLLVPTIACGGNVTSQSNDSDDCVEMGLGGEWTWELSGEKEMEKVQKIIFGAKEYNRCMERADSKNTADHNRCDKSKAGEACHDKADAQYEANRASCERVAHSDNFREAGVSFSKGASKTADTLPDHFYKGRD